MDTKDIIFDMIQMNIRKLYNDGDEENLEEIENLSIKICRKLGICEKCGAKLKGERNE